MSHFSSHIAVENGRIALVNGVQRWPFLSVEILTLPRPDMYDVWKFLLLGVMHEH